MGLCLARELHAAGARVVVYERSQASPEQLPVHAAAAGMAAWAAAGMLGPSGFPAASGLQDFARAAAGFYPDFSASLERETGMHCDYRRIGTLASRHGMGAAHVAGSEDHANSAWNEPQLVQPEDYVLIPGDHAVDNRKLLQALCQYSRKNKIAIQAGCEVVELQPSPDRTIQIRTLRERFHTRHAVIAAGAWSGRITGIQIPIVPRKGQILCVQAPVDLIRHVILGAEVYLVPRSDGRIIIGASLEDAGFDARIVPEIIARMHAAAAVMVPAIGEFPVLDRWCGFRPYSETRLPCLGPTHIPGIWAASGLFRDGILLAPLAAHELAGVLIGRRRNSDLLNSLHFNDGAAPERRREYNAYRFQ